MSTLHNLVQSYLTDYENTEEFDLDDDILFLEGATNILSITDIYLNSVDELLNILNGLIDNQSIKDEVALRLLKEKIETLNRL